MPPQQSSNLLAALASRPLSVADREKLLSRLLPRH